MHGDRGERGNDLLGEVTYGLRAGLAVFGARREQISRISHARDVRHELGEVLRWASSQRVPVREVDPRDLEQLAGARNHEGLCVEAKPRRFAPIAEVAELLSRGRGAAVALDRVRNPYNVGAILRSCAFFGVDVVLLGAPAPHPALEPDAVRVAEGGADRVTLSRTTDLASTLAKLREAGVRVIGADGASTTQAIGHVFPRPSVLVMGNEREGMGERVRAQCDEIVAIRGSGAIESLNVAVAAGVLVAELVRGRQGDVPRHDAQPRRRG